MRWVRVLLRHQRRLHVQLLQSQYSPTYGRNVSYSTWKESDGSR